MAFKNRDSEPKQEQKRIHAYVATPAYDGRGMTDFCISMTEAAQAAAVYGIQVTAAVMGNGAFIEIARNNFVRMFLESECTHLFFIDSDLRFEPRAFVNILLARLPVAAGMYRRRQEPEDYPVKLADYHDGGGLWVEEDWVMCDRVPTGFLCISREVIEEMVADPSTKYLEQPNLPLTPILFDTYLVPRNESGTVNTFMGEDFSWCEKYRAKYGKPIPVWPDWDFTHGGYKCNFYQYLSKEIEKEQREKEQAASAVSGQAETEAAA